METTNDRFQSSPYRRHQNGQPPEYSGENGQPPPPPPPPRDSPIVTPPNQQSHQTPDLAVAVAVAPPNQQPVPVQTNEQPILVPNEQQLQQLPNAQQQQNNHDLATVVRAACLAAATEIAAQSPQNQAVHPLYLHSLRLMVLLAFASILVAKNIAPRQTRAASVLDGLGVFFGVTAFFLAITISFPLFLRIISWIIYVLSLLTILICNCPRNLVPTNQWV